MQVRKKTKKDNYRKETMQIYLKERQELTEMDRKEKRLEKDQHKAQVGYHK